MRKIFIGIFVVIIAGLAVGYLLINEKLPQGRDEAAADQLARQMTAAINDYAWQKTGAVMWTFMGSHHHLWDRDRNLAQVKWGKYDVIVDLDKVEGVAFRDGVRLEGKKKDKLVKKAWKFWVNDSFWLNPVSKAFDAGTTRSLVTLKDGREGLMVSYSSGGNTPGDSYVWLLGEDYRPVSWKMWVSIIPIGGLEVPWSKWETTGTGVLICTLHDAAIDLKIDNLRTAITLQELTGGDDPFAILF